MRHRHKGYCLILLMGLFITTRANGQLSKVVYQIIEPGKVALKWYHQQLMHKDGVLLQRQLKGGDWERISPQPIKKGQYSIPDAVLQKDTIMKEMVEMLEEGTGRVNGLMHLNFIIKSFQSKDFAQYLGIYAEDETRGQQVRYRVVSTNKPIAISEWFDPSLVSVLLPPQNVETVKRGKRVGIKWTFETNRYYGVDVYRKHRDESMYTKLNDMPIMVAEKRDSNAYQKIPLQFEDVLPDKKGNYHYKLVSLGFFGEQSGQVSTFEVNHLPKIVPPPVHGFQVDSVITETVYLSWTPLQANITAYRLYEKNRYKAPFKLIKDLIPATDGHLVLKNQLPGDHYYYITAISESGDENPSDLALANVEDMRPPETPGALEATLDSNQVKLTWKEVQSEDLLGYQVFRSTTDSNNFMLLNAEPFKDAQYTEQLSKRAKSKFYYTVVAVDSALNRSKRPPAVSIVLRDLVAPVPPVFKKVKQESGVVRLEWVENAEPDLKSYILYRKVNDEKWELLAYLGHQSSYNDENIKAGSLVSYRLRAKDASGNESGFSKQVRLKLQTALSGEGQLMLAVKNKRKQSLLSWKWKGAHEAIRAYVVYADMDHNGNWLPKTTMIKKQQYKVNKVKGTKYRIQALGQQGKVYYSNIK